MGRTVLGRSDQRHIVATHLVPAVPPVPALLPTARRPVQGENAEQPGERGQTNVETNQRVADEL